MRCFLLATVFLCRMFVLDAATSLRVFAPALAADESKEESKDEAKDRERHEVKDPHHHHVGHWSILGIKVEVKSALHLWLTPLRITAVALTVMLQMSPMRSVCEMHLRKDVLRYDGYPFFTVLAGATQWTLYGAAAAWATRDTTYYTMIESNGPGVILGLFYICVYCKYVKVGDERRGNMRRYLSAGFSVLVVEIVSLFVWHRKAVFWFGFVGAIGSVQIGAAPFCTIREVIETRSTACWPTDLISICFVQSAVTAVFGFCISDSWIWVPNVFGFVAASTQLAFIAWAAAGQPEAASGLDKLGRKALNWHLERATGSIS